MSETETPPGGRPLLPPFNAAFSIKQILNSGTQVRSRHAIDLEDITRELVPLLDESVENDSRKSILVLQLRTLDAAFNRLVDAATYDSFDSRKIKMAADVQRNCVATSTAIMKLEKWALKKNDLEIRKQTDMNRRNPGAGDA